MGSRLLVLLATICFGNIFCADVVFEPLKAELPQLTDGGWQLSEDWSGYMGVSSKFNDDKTFDYWFYSDCKMMDEPAYTVHGTWKWDGPVLQLITDAHLYDTKYHAMKFNGVSCLFPDGSFVRIGVKEQPPDFSRIHFQNKAFKSETPFDGRTPTNIKAKE